MPKLLTKSKVIRISETQLKTLEKMKSYNINVGKFIRDNFYGFSDIIYFYFVYLFVEIQEVDNEKFI